MVSAASYVCSAMQRRFARPPSARHALTGPTQGREGATRIADPLPAPRGGSSTSRSSMGTSVRELEDTYFRFLTRTDDQLRAAFDAYDMREATG